jgi:hypothetical protein
MSKLHVVLSCTNRKRAPVAASLRLGSLSGDIEDRAATWIERLEEASFGVEAERLYAGEYWRAGMNLRTLARERSDVDVWVLSAGFGLIGIGQRICPYGATLSAGHADSVVRRTVGSMATSCQRRRWWAALSSWDGPGGDGSRRTLAALAAQDPDASILVCAGQDYLEAVSEDLVQAQNRLACSEHLLVFGSAAPSKALASSWVQVPGRLRTCLGGSLSSTGVRAAMAALDACPATSQPLASAARRVVGALVESSEGIPAYQRKRLDDHEIEEWIRRHTQGISTPTKSTALRTFRDEGMACEQSRFGQLFDAAREIQR